MSASVDHLTNVMRKLRDPETGCPWDIKQDFKSIAPCTLEEAYEVVEAIESDDHEHFCEELGDLLLQIVFHAQMADEKGLFSFDDVAHGQAEKLIERHPHVFGDREGVHTPSDVLKNWEADKAAKRAAKAEAANQQKPSALDGVSTALPALTRAQKIQKRAARVGFDWNNVADFLSKIREELAEFEHEVHEGSAIEKMEDELGDVLFAVIGVASFMKLDAERALRATNRKFERRFKFVESALAAQGQTMQDTSLNDMETLWREAKSSE
ncbi:MAG: nucleoside triphosphate pyrophosphohydrolase [Alphaproteobacteria bacterium]|nr:nucleoside triphosphate pyrophosphohydrolase [Alphaproteobacteria bacterium]